MWRCGNEPFRNGVNGCVVTWCHRPSEIGPLLLAADYAKTDQSQVSQVRRQSTVVRPADSRLPPRRTWENRSDRDSQRVAHVRIKSDCYSLSHLELIRLELPPLQWRARRGGQLTFSTTRALRSSNGHTCTPPGKLTELSISTASCLEPASTFHRLAAT